jgi:hypothetical protein
MFTKLKVMLVIIPCVLLLVISTADNKYKSSIITSAKDTSSSIVESKDNTKVGEEIKVERPIQSVEIMDELKIEPVPVAIPTPTPVKMPAPAVLTEKQKWDNLVAEKQRVLKDLCGKIIKQSSSASFEIESKCGVYRKVSCFYFATNDSKVEVTKCYIPLSGSSKDITYETALSYLQGMKK